MGPSDAAFVMTAHTETRSFGSADSLGQTNFWINGAETQPMCKLSTTLASRVCSHGQIQEYWMEAVRTNSSTVFPARRCDSYTKFMANGCSTNDVTYMNTLTPSTYPGNFYLNTNVVQPYSRQTADP